MIRIQDRPQSLAILGRGTQIRGPRLRLVAVEQIGPIAEGPTLCGPNCAGDLLRTYFVRKDREHFVALHLESAHRVASMDVVSVGTLNSALVHPREVFKAAILASAAAIICAHNHPSGNVSPSPEDRATFDLLSGAGRLLKIPLLDFLIVGEERTWSAVEHGRWS